MKSKNIYKYKSSLMFSPIALLFTTLILSCSTDDTSSDSTQPTPQQNIEVSKIVKPTPSTLQGYGVAIDSNSNLYVTGHSNKGIDGNTLTGITDGFITQLDASGEKKWTRQFGADSASTYAFGLAIDSTNNVYIIGNTTGKLDGNNLTGNKDLFVTKYSSSGVKTWTKQLGSALKDTSGVGIAISSNQNIYVTGYTYGSLTQSSSFGTVDMFIMMFTADGQLQWVNQLGVASRETFGHKVAVDAYGNAYITGYTTGNLDNNQLSGTTDCFVTKYNSAGMRQWTKLLGSSSRNTFGMSIVIDSLGNIEVSGYTNGNLIGNTNNATDSSFFIAQYTPSGTRQWIKQLSALPNSDTGSNAVGTFGFGMIADLTNPFVYATGFTQGKLNGNSLMGAQDYFLAQYDLSGNRKWVSQLGAQTGTSTTSTSVTVDNSHRIYITGYSNGNLDGNTLTGTQDLFITQYNSSGIKQWTKQIGVTN